MNVAEAQAPAVRSGNGMRWLTALVRFVVGVLFCLHPLTAILALGWLTRRMHGQIAALKEDRPSPRWPGMLTLSRPEETGRLRRWFGGLAANVKVGLKALAAILFYTLPFSGLWYFGWFAGWENSFSKGYEQAFFWPSVSLGAVIVSVPLLVLLPMAIAHQAATNRVGSVLELRTIFALYRRTPWRNLGLLFLIMIGFAALLGVRVLPTFAEHMSERVAGGNPQEVAQYLDEVRLLATALLFTGLLVLRSAMARIYARAQVRLTDDGPGSLVAAIICYAVSLAVWLAIVFSIFVAQFMNYHWLSWLNQPVLMLPWLGLPA